MNQITFRRFGTMIDCSRNAVMSIPALKRWMDILVKLGYNTLLLYTEDTFEVQNQPYFGHLRGRYTTRELRDLDAYAQEKGVELIPCIQTLAHLNAIFDWGCYDSVRDCNDILLVGEEETYRLLEDIFATVADTYSSKLVNIGMDEAWMLGRGKYMDREGFQNRSQILIDHLKHVSEIARKYDFELTMWGDMFFELAGGDKYANAQIDKQIKEQIPDNVHLVYWDYYTTEYEQYDQRIKGYNNVKEDCWFAGGLWTWRGFAPHNAHSIKATAAALAACRQNEVKDIFLTMWGDNGGECSRFALLPSLYFAAEAAKGNTDMSSIKAGFFKEFGVAFDDFMALDLGVTPNADTHCNADKYLLYNDCFMGKMDATVRETDATSFAVAAEKLKAGEEDNTYGYLFTTQRTLCEVLSHKADLGIRTRKAYMENNREELSSLVVEYAEVEKLTERFYEAFCDQWMKENKPHGFDVQDQRLGGLLQRIRHCGKTLSQYVKGEISSIPELEEPVLHHSGNSDMPAGAVVYNSWSGTVSANPI